MTKRTLSASVVGLIASIGVCAMLAAAAVVASSATNTDYAAQASAALKKTTISYPEWQRRVAQGRYADVTVTEWWKAFDALSKISDTPPVTTTTTTPPQSSELTWAPPALTNPQTIVIPDDGPVQSPGLPHVLQLGSGDYILKLGARRCTTSPYGGISITGGHNIVIIGGSIDIAGTTDEDGAREALVFHGQTGTVHVEGVHILGKPLRAFVLDANAVFQLENIRVDGVYMWHENFGNAHSDSLITWKSPTDIRIDKYTTDYDNSGFAIYRQNASYPGRVRYKRVNMRRGATQYGHAAVYWPGPSTRMDIEDLWVETGFQTTGAGDDPSITGYQWTLADAFLGPANGDLGAAPSRVMSGDGRTPGSTLEYTNPAVDHIYGVGAANAIVKYGVPPGGDFVPAGVAGPTYVSPGYP